jgi:nucleoside-diphosphate-sugar epimerase
MSRFYLVTGGTGFLGSSLVRRLLIAGHRVRVLDNQARGSLVRLADVQHVCGVDGVWHLAFINGTEFFYTMPDLVLEVGIKGIMNVIDACLKQGVGELIVASSSEVYQKAPIVPTDETAPLSIPDPLNPRYSYAAGKLISEIVALNYGRSHFDRVLVFRPHNVYGPNMGWEHVIPEFILRMKVACSQHTDPVPFPIQGDGKQTRAFVFVDDFIDGLMLVMEKGEHLNIYHIGTSAEVTIESLAGMVGEYFGRRVAVATSTPALGGTLRRCPDIQKLAALGYAPKCSLRDGLHITAKWYDEHSSDAPMASQRVQTGLDQWKIAKT